MEYWLNIEFLFKLVLTALDKLKNTRWSLLNPLDEANRTRPILTSKRSLSKLIELNTLQIYTDLTGADQILDFHVIFTPGNSSF